MTTYTNEDAAITAMKQANRAHRTELVVLVDGPEEGEFTIMPLRDAIENEFMYRWEV